MVKISAFKAIRPVRDKASLVASRSYLTYSENTIKEKLDNNPYTFLHIINTEYKKKNKQNDKQKFLKIKEKFTEFVDKKILIRDKTNCFYVYQQKNELKTYTGIIGAAAVKDYLSGKIKKHELTLKKREEKFCNYLKLAGFNAEPVLLCYKENSNINNIIQKYILSRAEYEFTTTDKSLHKLWIINNNDDIKKISKEFKKIDDLYIADGHHRTASSALLSKASKTESSSYFMSYLLSEKQLNILSFNRLIKSLNNLTAKNFICKIREKFNVVERSSHCSSTQKNQFSMYLENQWYSISLKKNYNKNSNKLDPSILSFYILKPILNIIDERTDKNITFVEGNVPTKELKKQVDNSNYKVAFILKPIIIDDIKKIADKGDTLPPKSTYVEPKLRSGLTIYPI
tara:strand:- start:11487 stop:12686 length:1200 start_codon:yes stop_codon:yes gene_type:complete